MSGDSAVAEAPVATVFAMSIGRSSVPAKPLYHPTKTKIKYATGVLRSAYAYTMSAVNGMSKTKSKTTTNIAVGLSVFDCHSSSIVDGVGAAVVSIRTTRAR